MQIFYCGAYLKPDVSASEPVDVTEEDARNVFARLGPREDCFLGVLLGDGRTLQLRFNSDGTVYTEVLTETDLSFRHCMLNVPLAERLVEAAFRGENFEEKIAFAQIVWADDSLKINGT